MTVTATVSASATAGADIVNTANVISDELPLPGGCIVNTDLASDTDQCDAVTTPVVAEPTPVLKIDKGDPAGTFYPGSTITYPVTIGNTGTGDATNVIVTDLGGTNLDPASVVLSAPSAGTVSGSTWTVGTLAAGATATVTVTATVSADWDGVTSAVNMAIVESTELPSTSDVCVSNDTLAADDDQCDFVVTDPQPHVIKVDKAAESDSFVQGDWASYTLTVTNDGPGVAVDVVVTDTPGAGLDATTFEAVGDPSQGTVDNATLTWTVGTLKAGESATMKVRVKVLDDATTVENDADVTDTAYPDLPGTCVENADVASDTDRCDTVSHAASSGSGGGIDSGQVVLGGSPWLAGGIVVSVLGGIAALVGAARRRKDELV